MSIHDISYTPVPSPPKNTSADRPASLMVSTILNIRQAASGTTITSQPSASTLNAANYERVSVINRDGTLTGEYAPKINKNSPQQQNGRNTYHYDAGTGGWRQTGKVIDVDGRVLSLPGGVSPERPAEPGDSAASSSQVRPPGKDDIMAWLSLTREERVAVGIKGWAQSRRINVSTLYGLVNLDGVTPLGASRLTGGRGPTRKELKTWDEMPPGQRMAIGAVAWAANKGIHIGTWTPLATNSGLTLKGRSQLERGNPPTEDNMWAWAGMTLQERKDAGGAAAWAASQGITVSSWRKVANLKGLTDRGQALLKGGREVTKDDMRAWGRMTIQKRKDAGGPLKWAANRKIDVGAWSRVANLKGLTILGEKMLDGASRSKRGQVKHKYLKEWDGMTLQQRKDAGGPLKWALQRKINISTWGALATYEGLTARGQALLKGGRAPRLEDLDRWVRMTQQERKEAGGAAAWALERGINVGTWGNLANKKGATPKGEKMLARLRDMLPPERNSQDSVVPSSASPTPSLDTDAYIDRLVQQMMEESMPTPVGYPYSVQPASPALWQLLNEGELANLHHMYHDPDTPAPLSDTGADIDRQVELMDMGRPAPSGSPYYVLPDFPASSGSENIDDLPGRAERDNPHPVGPSGRFSSVVPRPLSPVAEETDAFFSREDINSVRDLLLAAQGSFNNQLIDDIPVMQLEALSARLPGSNIVITITDTTQGFTGRRVLRLNGDESPPRPGEIHLNLLHSRDTMHYEFRDRKGGRVATLPDGNCFYHAVAGALRQYGKTGLGASVLRGLVAGVFAADARRWLERVDLQKLHEELQEAKARRMSTRGDSFTTERNRRFRRHSDDDHSPEGEAAPASEGVARDVTRQRTDQTTPGHQPGHKGGAGTTHATESQRMLRKRALRSSLASLFRGGGAMLQDDMTLVDSLSLSVESLLVSPEKKARNRQQKADTKAYKKKLESIKRLIGERIPEPMQTTEHEFFSDINQKIAALDKDIKKNPDMTHIQTGMQALADAFSKRRKWLKSPVREKITSALNETPRNQVHIDESNLWADYLIALSALQKETEVAPADAGKAPSDRMEVAPEQSAAGISFSASPADMTASEYLPGPFIADGDPFTEMSGISRRNLTPQVQVSEAAGNLMDALAFAGITSPAAMEKMHKDLRMIPPFPGDIIRHYSELEQELGRSLSGFSEGTREEIIRLAEATKTAINALDRDLLPETYHVPHIDALPPEALAGTLADLHRQGRADRLLTFIKGNAIVQRALRAVLSDEMKISNILLLSEVTSYLQNTLANPEISPDAVYRALMPEAQGDRFMLLAALPELMDTPVGRQLIHILTTSASPTGLLPELEKDMDTPSLPEWSISHQKDMNPSSFKTRLRKKYAYDKKVRGRARKYASQLKLSPQQLAGLAATEQYFNQSVSLLNASGLTEGVWLTETQPENRQEQDFIPLVTMQEAMQTDRAIRTRRDELDEVAERLFYQAEQHQASRAQVSRDSLRADLNRLAGFMAVGEHMRTRSRAQKEAEWQHNKAQQLREMGISSAREKERIWGPPAFSRPGPTMNMSTRRKAKVNDWVGRTGLRSGQEPDTTQQQPVGMDEDLYTQYSADDSELGGSTLAVPQAPADDIPGLAHADEYSLNEASQHGGEGNVSPESDESDGGYNPEPLNHGYLSIAGGNDIQDDTDLLDELYNAIQTGNYSFLKDYSDDIG